MSTVPRIPTLNGLRALACLAVFGVHWQQFTRAHGLWGPFDFERLLENGNTGVAMLFMLSAFLLSLRFWSGRYGTRGQSWVGRYAWSRGLRIIPAYYLCLAAVVVASSHYLTAKERLDTFLHVMFVHNLRESSFYSLAPSFWTLGVQAQSYVWLPIVMVALLRLSSSWRTHAWILAGLVAASYGGHWILSSAIADGAAGLDWLREQQTVASHSLLAHVPHFLLGLLAGVIYSRRTPTSSKETYSGLREASVWAAGLAVLLILATPQGDRFEVPFGRYHFPYVPLLIMSIILEAPRTRVARAVLDSPPLNLLGTISFGVYVYHYPAMALVERILRPLDLAAASHWSLFGLCSLLVTIVVAGVSYVVIEAPLLRRPQVT